MAFAVGFALLGPLVVKVAGPEVLILTVAILYLVAMVFVITLPSVLPATAGTSSGFAVTTPNGRSRRSSASCARG